MGEINQGIKINDLFMWCNDIHEMREFYSNVLGLEEAWLDESMKDGNAYLGYRLGNGQTIHFIHRTDNHPVHQNWAYQPSSEIPDSKERFSWTLEVPQENLKIIFDKLIEHEIETYQSEIGKRTTYSAITVKDPMGNTIDIYYLHEE